MYTAINEHRMPFDIDGSEIGYRYQSNVSLATLFGNGVSSWLDSLSQQNLNSENRLQEWGAYANKPGFGFWFFFPELREVSKLCFQYPASGISSISEHTIQGSPDTTNGMDGTWEDAVYSLPTPSPALDAWRTDIFTVSFSGPMKAIRLGLRSGSYADTIKLCAVHVYGRKAVGEQPDDIAFCDTDGNELTSLLDWADRPEGTTGIQAMKMKNTSQSKIADNVNLQLNHDDFTIGWSSEGPWQSVLDIASIGPNSLSSLFYVRNELAEPPLTLGPKTARIIATVGSWT